MVLPKAEIEAELWPKRVSQRCDGFLTSKLASSQTDAEIAPRSSMLYN